MSIRQISLMEVRGHFSLFFCAWRPNGEERVKALFFWLFEVINSSSEGGNWFLLSLVVSSYFGRLVLVSDIVDGGILRLRS